MRGWDSLRSRLPSIATGTKIATLYGTWRATLFPACCHLRSPQVPTDFSGQQDTQSSRATARQEQASATALQIFLWSYRRLSHTVTRFATHRHIVTRWTSHVTCQHASTPCTASQPLSETSSGPLCHNVSLQPTFRPTLQTRLPFQPPVTSHCRHFRPARHSAHTVSQCTRESRALIIAGTEKMTIIILSLYIYLILTQKTWLMFRMQVNII